MAKPFRIVVLGDSIMWGQGLADHEKFTIKIRDWLAQQLSRPVTMEVFAHSRAVIEADATRDREPALPGELPNKYPSITAQANQVADPGEVDLVLLNGGINDMGAEKIVNPFHLHNLNWIRQQSEEHCGKMTGLLQSAILPRMARAAVVVVGYYPLISEQSDPLKVAKLTGLLCENLPGIKNILQSFNHAIIKPLAAQSAAWINACDHTMKAAVDAANLQARNRGAWWMTAAAPATQTPPQFAFAPVNFAAEHCYAAPATLLWLLHEADSMMVQRVKQCMEFAVTNPTCPVEAAFHPNRQGALAYEAAIKSVLTKYLSHWR